MGGCVAKSFDSGEMSLHSPRPILNKSKSKSSLKQVQDPLLIGPPTQVQITPIGEMPRAELNKSSLRRKSQQQQPQLPQTIDLHSPLSYLESQEKAKSTRNLTAGIESEAGETQTTNPTAIRRKTLRPASSNGSRLAAEKAGNSSPKLQTPTSPVVVGVNDTVRRISRTGAPSPFPRATSSAGFGAQQDSSKADFLAFMVRTQLKAHSLRNWVLLV